MLKILLSLTIALPSIYTLTITNSKGQSILLESCRGKKILLVNISTGSPKNYQMIGLQELHARYKDSLVILAFPSNSFGTESRSDQEIDLYCRSNYGTRFLIAAKGGVTGESIQPVYHWLSDSSANGVANLHVSGDFHKYLIDANGQLIGTFSPGVEPLDSSIQKAILGIE